jgi:regulatory protein
MIEEPSDWSQCYQTALRLLSRREYSRKELSSKLADKECSSIGKLLDELENTGYQSDYRFTESFVRGRLSRGQGIKKIAYDIKQRGIENAMLNDVLAELEVDWLTLAIQQREKRFGQVLPTDFKEKMKQSRFLMGRGFDHETIQAVFGTTR